MNVLEPFAMSLRNACINMPTFTVLRPRSLGTFPQPIEFSVESVGGHLCR